MIVNKLKFLICPDKFKETFDAFQMTKLIENEIKLCFCNAITFSCPMSDGGDGMADILLHQLKAEKIPCKVHNPVFKHIDTYFIYQTKTQKAWIESAKASGLALLSDEERNPMFTSSIGTGELILKAIANGAKHIFLGLGGSATNDAGIGMASALGYRFLDKNTDLLLPIGKNLKNIVDIDISNVNTTLSQIKFTAAVDVSNPLFGKNGAAHVFAFQKGASTEDIEFLDAGLIHFSKIAQNYFGKGYELNAGAGAAGGMGAGACWFLNANIKQGIELIFEHYQFDALAQTSDWIITGEGRLDHQSLQGKVVSQTIAVAKKYRKKLMVICGKSKLTQLEARNAGIDALIALFETDVDLLYAKENTAMQIKQKIKYLAENQMLQ